jgi:ribulose-5-phosphate 4-epimerase/fuculose-1-phosphate aldolase
VADTSEIRERIARACRVLGRLNLTKAATGHVSARLPGTDRIFIRARGPRELGVRYTTAAEVIEVDLDGGLIAGPAGLLPPSEMFIHTELYRARSDVQAVVHMHPPKVVLFTICNAPLRPVFGAYDPAAARLAIGGIPTYPRSIMIRTPELGRELAQTVGGGSIALMKGHGITTVHRSIEDAALDAIAVNELATMNYEAALLGAPTEISDEDREYFRERRDAGRYKAGDDGKPGERAQAVWQYYVALTEAG